MATKVKARPAVRKVNRVHKTHKARPHPVAAKPKARTSAATGEPEPLPDSWHMPPATQDECLERIHTLGHRVEDYIRFMKKIEDVRGTSSEAKQKALSAFYERMLVLERELGRIQEELQLG